MTSGKFEGDAEHLVSQIEEMAKVVYGVPKNAQSSAIAKETADLLMTLSQIKFELEEEPLPPPPPGAEEGGDG